MAFRAIRVALLLSILPAVGCGSVSNLADSCHTGDGYIVPFGGVKHDMACMKGAASDDGAHRAHAKSEPTQYPRATIMVLSAADLPLSLAVDVALWPYTKAYNFINESPPVPPLAIGGAGVVQSMAMPAVSQPLPPVTQPMAIPVPPLSSPMPIPAVPAAPVPAVVGGVADVPGVK